MYSFYELAIFCLVELGIERPHLLAQDPTMKQHFTAALPLFREMVKEDKQRFDAFAGGGRRGRVIPVMDRDAAHTELICGQCKCCLFNFHLSGSQGLLCHHCWDEMDAKKKKKRKGVVTGRLRFKAMKDLDILLQRHVEMCNDLKVL
jgi:hypothetical protein